MQNKNRIVHLLDNAYTNDSRVEKEINTLLKRGYQITLYAMKKDDLPKEEIKGDLVVKRILDPILTRPFSKGYSKYLKSISELIAGEEFDFLHCHDHRMITLGAMIKELKKEISLIYDAHEYLSGWPYYQKIPGFINRFKGGLVWQKFVAEEKKSVPKADWIITISDSIGQLMVDRFKLKKKPLIIRNVPHVSKIQGKGYFQNYFDIPNSKKIVLHLGGLYHTDERIGMLIRVVNEFNSMQLVFMGGAKTKSILDRVAKKYHLSGKYLYHPAVAVDEVLYIASAADIGVVHTWNPKWLSHWYSLPNKIMEYSLASLAIAATSQPEFEAFANQYHHIELYKGDQEDSLKNALQKIEENLDELTGMASKIAATLNWETESQKLLEIYPDLSN